MSDTATVAVLSRHAALATQLDRAGLHVVEAAEPATLARLSQHAAVVVVDLVGLDGRRGLVARLSRTLPPHVPVVLVSADTVDLALLGTTRTVHVVVPTLRVPQLVRAVRRALEEPAGPTSVGTVVDLRGHTQDWADLADDLLTWARDVPPLGAAARGLVDDVERRFPGVAAAVLAHDGIEWSVAAGAPSTGAQHVLRSQPADASFLVWAGWWGSPDAVTSTALEAVVMRHESGLRGALQLRRLARGLAAHLGRAAQAADRLPLSQ